MRERLLHRLASSCYLHSYKFATITDVVYVCTVVCSLLEVRERLLHRLASSCYLHSYKFATVVRVCALLYANSCYLHSSKFATLTDVVWVCTVVCSLLLPPFLYICHRDRCRVRLHCSVRASALLYANSCYLHSSKFATVIDVVCVCTVVCSLLLPPFL